MCFIFPSRHQVLQALAPAALELSLQARQEVERERGRLVQHWQQQIQRTQYEVYLCV
jgi:hypothetical protein